MKKYGQGVMISIITSTVNMIYKYLARYLTEKQNHKYLQDKDRTFMLNMVIFKLINVNFTVVWTVNQIVKHGLPEDVTETKLEYI